MAGSVNKKCKTLLGTGCCGAYLTVYVALSMTILISLFLTLMEGVRRSAVRMESEIITEIGLDSILAEYHQEMLEQYNLFFIDTSYGRNKPSLAQTQEHLLCYIQHNCNMNDVLLGDFLYRDLLGLKADSVEIVRTMAASDYDGRVLAAQASQVIKDDLGIVYLEEIKNWLQTVEGYGLAERNLEQEKNEVDYKIEEYDGTEIQVSEEEWTKVEIHNPTERLELRRSAGILKLVIEDSDTISQAGVDLRGLFSSRKDQGMILKGNLSEDEAGKEWYEALLLPEYALRYTGHYGESFEKGLLKYQTEYMIAGKDNDTDNLKGVANRICAIREAANAVYLFSDDVKCAEAEVVAAAAASAMLLPEITPLLKISLLFGWAYAESLYDVKLLLGGGRVPLLKNSESWHYDIECVFQDEVDSAQSDTQGMSYEDYLRVLLAMTDGDKMTARLMDIMEMDIRLTPGNQYFKIDGCIDRVEAAIRIKSDYGYEVLINRTRGYG